MDTKKIEANSIEELYNGFKNPTQSNKTLSIKIEDINKSIELKNIDFSPIYNECQNLTLSIKSIITGQEDYDIFFQSFSKFKSLKQLQLKFYNKQVQFLDSLFLNLKDIGSITLDFTNFRKICLKEQYKDKFFLAKSININLENAKIDKNSIQKFADFFGSHQNLQILVINMDQQCSIGILSNIQKETKVYLRSVKTKSTKKSCDQMIQLLKENKSHIFQNMDYYYLCMTLQEYLTRNGLILKQQSLFNCFNQKDQFDIQYVYMDDFLLLQEIPYIIDALKEKSNISKSIKIKFNSLKLFYKYLLNIVDQLFDKIVFQSYNYNDQQKILKIDKYNWQIEIQEQKFNFPKNFNNIVYLNLKFSDNNHNNKELIYHFLRKQKYLISIQIPSNITEKKIIRLTNIIQQNSQIFLAYLIFKKHIYDLMPIPNQIFYDLIQKD